MPTPAKIQNWIDKNILPQRLLISGPGDNLSLALDIARQLQKVDSNIIKSGLHADTLFFADKGKSFKTKYSDQAKKDEQSENENASGLIKWANKKPVAPYRIVILENLERANREAMNKLLKLIEEPPLKTVFLFTTQNHFCLLDTVISRVTVVSLSPDTLNTPDLSEARTFLTSSNILKKFRFIEALDKETKNNPQKKINRQVVLNFLKQCLSLSRQEPSLQTHLELIFETYRAIERNMNIRFTLERLALQLKK